MSVDDLKLTKIPSTKVEMLIRRPPHEVFQAIADPSVTAKFWFTKSSGKMTAGAGLLWEWEMYGASSKISVKEVEENSRILFSWSGSAPDSPTTVEFRFVPWQDDTTYVQVTEAGFSGDADTLVKSAIDSTAGFTFVLSALKALLEHGVVLRLVLDAHPAGLEV